MSRIMCADNEIADAVCMCVDAIMLVPTLVPFLKILFVQGHF